MGKLPTDLDVLEAVYEDSRDRFDAFDPASPSRAEYRYVPLDIGHIANKLGTGTEIVLGRLYHHFERKYGYEVGDVTVHFFALSVQWPEHLREVGKWTDTNCVNFPYLVSVLADLRHERSRVLRTWYVSLIAVTISIVSLGVTVTKAVVEHHSPAPTKEPPPSTRQGLKIDTTERPSVAG